MTNAITRYADPNAPAPSWTERLRLRWRRWMPERPFADTGARPSRFGINLFVLGLLVRRREDAAFVELFLGPGGWLVKLQVRWAGGETGGVHLRIAADVVRSYLVAFLLDLTLSPGGWHHVLELLVGPFGYVAHFVERIDWGAEYKKVCYRLLLFPGGILLRHDLTALHESSTRVDTHLSVGPWHSILGAGLEFERGGGRPAGIDVDLALGPKGSVLRATYMGQYSRTERLRVFGGLRIGPSGSLARTSVGLDTGRKPVRPYFEAFAGPGQRWGFFYRHGGEDAWIAGLDRSSRKSRTTRVLAFDTVAVPGEPTDLVAMLVEGMPGLLAPPVPGKRVRFLIDGREVGRAWSGEDGWVQVRVPGPPEGDHRMEVRAERGGASDPPGETPWQTERRIEPVHTARVHAVRPDRPYVLLRLEGLLVAGWDTSFARRDWSHLEFTAGAAEPLREIARFASFLYITDMPIQYVAWMRGFCFGDGGESLRLPRGPIIPVAEESLSRRLARLPFPADEQRSAQFRIERLVAELADQRVAIVTGVSHRSADVAALANMDIEAVTVRAQSIRNADPADLAEKLNALAEPDAVDRRARRASDLAERWVQSRGDTAETVRWRIRLLTGVAASQHNRIRLFPDAGEAVERIFESIDRATDAVCLSTMILGADRIGTKLTDRLIAAADRGVPVRLIVDQWLSVHTETFANANVGRLAESGVDLRVRRLADGFARCHKKTVTTLRTGPDGTRTLDAFAGGMNWCDPSFGNFAANLDGEELENPERDLFAQVWGPAAVDLQRDFLDVWEWTARGADDSAIDRDSLLAPSDPATVDAADGDPYSDVPVHVVGTIPGRDVRIIRTFLALIASARERICIEQNFPPGPQIVAALVEAMKRGVRVDWIFGARKGASALLSDNLNHHKAALLLRAGAKIDAAENPMRARRYPITVHMKAMVVDARVLYFGTANLDNLSLEWDAETMLVVPSPRAAGAFLADWFEPDFARSTPVTYNPVADTLTIDGREETPFARLDRILVDALMPEEVA